MKLINHETYYSRNTIVQNIVDDDGVETVLVTPPNKNPRVAEVNIMPSRTIPDMVPTLKEMVERYRRGADIEVFSAVFTDNEFIPDNWERMDECERLDYARNLKANLNERWDNVHARIALEKAEEDAKKNTVEPEPEPEPKFDLDTSNLFADNIDKSKGRK